MAADYQVSTFDAYGNRLDVLAYDRLEYVLKDGDVGLATITLPGWYDASKLMLDGKVAIERAIGGGPAMLEGETMWLIRYWDWTLSNDQYNLVVRAYHPNHLLTRRTVDYPANSSQAKARNEYADNLLKRIIRQNYSGQITNGVSPDVSAYLSVAADVSLAQKVSHSYSNDEVMKVCQDVAAMSTQAGTYLTYDIVAPTATMLEFRTYTGQRGTDRRAGSAAPLLIGPDYGNLADVRYTLDRSEEKNAGIAGGSGQEEQRQYGRASDSARTGESPLNYCADFTTANTEDSSAALTAAAEGKVRDGRPKKTFSATLVETNGTMYGIHYGFGDQVTAQAFNYGINCFVDTIHVTVDGDGEQVDTKLGSVQS